MGARAPTTVLLASPLVIDYKYLNMELIYFIVNRVLLHCSICNVRGYILVSRKFKKKVVSQIFVNQE